MSTTTKDEVFQSNGQDWKVFVAEPDTPKGAVIVIHEIWGLNDDIRRITNDFAEAGYVAFAPDLYSNDEGVQELSPEVFQRVFGEPFSSNTTTALHDLKQWIESKGWKSEQIVAVGFCFGGTYAVRYLLELDEIAGAVSFYGQAPDADVANDLSKPILSFYGDDDHGFDEMRDQMINYGKQGLPIEVKTYQNAAHSFMNKHREGSYKPEAAADAWQRTLSFIQKVTTQDAD